MVGGVKNNSKVFGLSKWEKGGEMRKIRGRMGL